MQARYTARFAYENFRGAMQALYFTAAALVLYLVADRLLDAFERRAGRRFEYRSLIFFAMLLGLSLVTFALIRAFFGTA